MSPMFQLTGMTRPEQLKPALLKNFAQTAERNVAMLSQQVNIVKKNAGGKGVPPQVKAQVTAMEEQLRQAQQGATQAAQMKNIADGLSGTGKVHYEIYYKAESRELILATSNPPGQKFGRPGKK
jgi:hypothetical protein